MEEQQSLPEVRKSITQDQINRYAAVSGDRNLIHLDPEFAANSAFGRIVAHGMLLLAFVSEMLTQAFGKSWLENGRLKVRFRAPVYPGENVTTYGQVTKVTAENDGLHVQCTVGCRNTEMQDVITGEASILVADGQNT